MRLSIILAALLVLATPAWAQTGGGTAPISATGGSYSAVNCLIKSATSTSTSCSGITDNGTTVSTSEIVSISNNTNVYQASFINTPAGYALKVCDTTTTTRCAGIGFDASGSILGAYLQGVNIGTAYTPTMIGPSGGLVELGVSGATGTDHEVAFAKTTASGTAPGALAAKESWVCGTNPGTMKKIDYAGTSTTPTTEIDNVGGGVTGC